MLIDVNHTWTDSDRAAGVDEAGRGPLAGPVFAAAVILDPEHPVQDLADSKTINAKKRNFLAEEIKTRSLAWSVARIDVSIIDNINILQASLLAMSECIKKLSITPVKVLVDGNQAPEINMEVETIIKGDSLVPAISAASILAKVERDKEMIEMDSIYPMYGFARHKGYPTREHLLKLAEYGVCPIHRKSFSPVKRILELNRIY